MKHIFILNLLQYVFIQFMIICYRLSFFKKIDSLKSIPKKTQYSMLNCNKSHIDNNVKKTNRNLNIYQR